MTIQFHVIKNDIITTLIMSIITTIVTLINIPRNKYIDHQGHKVDINRAWIAIKTFFISFVLFYALIYFFSTDPKSSLISHMKQGEPTF